MSQKSSSGAASLHQQVAAATGASTKDWQCMHCQRRFTRKEHLLRHRRSHTKELPYACPTCPQRFRRQDVYRRHLRKSCPGQPPAASVPGAGNERRDKIVKACERCRLQKVRCNRAAPCDRCKRQGKSCSNVPNTLPRPSSNSPILEASADKVDIESVLPTGQGPSPRIRAHNNATPARLTQARRPAHLSFIGGILPEEAFEVTSWSAPLSLGTWEDNINTEDLHDHSRLASVKAQDAPTFEPASSMIGTLHRAFVSQHGPERPCWLYQRAGN